MSGTRRRQHAPKRKKTDLEKLETFMRSFHSLSQKAYWPRLRSQIRLEQISEAELRVDLDSGAVAMKKSPFDPISVDLAGAYMRKLLTGTDVVQLGNLLNIIGKKCGPSLHLDDAKDAWKQAQDRRFEFLADGDRITTMRIDFPRAWTEGRPRDEGERREVRLAIADFATPYFYTGFLHDHDDESDTPTRKLVRSLPPVFQIYMAHLGIATTLYISVIAHHAIGTNRPELCLDGCQEAEIMARNVASMTGPAVPESAANSDEE